MEEPDRVGADTWVLPTPFAIPGLGSLYINASVIKGRESATDVRDDDQAAYRDGFNRFNRANHP